MHAILLFIMTLIANIIYLIIGYKRGLADALKAFDEVFEDLKNELEKEGNIEQD